MIKLAKQRLDILMVKKGLVQTREKAKKTILAGVVFVNGQRIDKAGALVNPEDEIIVKENPIPYASRGGLKLEKAIETFNIPVKNKIYMDVGASTGGFTDCLLKNGALKVYSIDVGYGQLAWELRQDPRVVVMERTNIRYLKPEDLEDVPQGAVIDVSFISLKLVLPVVREILAEDSHIVALIKPQFEAGKEKVGKNGVVRDPDIHKQVLYDILTWCLESGFVVEGLTFSPVKGPKGNIEFLLHIRKNENIQETFDINEIVSKVVDEAYAELASQ